MINLTPPTFSLLEYPDGKKIWIKFYWDGEHIQKAEAIEFATKLKKVLAEVTLSEKMTEKEFFKSETCKLLLGRAFGVF